MADDLLARALAQRLRNEFDVAIGNILANISQLQQRSATTLVGGTDATIISWVDGEDYSILTTTLDEHGNFATATLTWPDSSPGTYELETLDPIFLCPTSYSFYHTATGKTIYQPPITRDAATGAVLVKPYPIVTPPGDYVTPSLVPASTIGYYPTLAAYRAAHNKYIFVLMPDSLDRIGMWVKGIEYGADDGVNYALDVDGIAVKRLY